MAVPVVLLLLAVTSQSVVGLLAIWAGLGRGNWFVRVAALGAVLALALLIPAYELVIVFTVQCLVVVPTLLIARRLRARSEGTPASQFTIRDLLLMTAVVAVTVAVVVNVPRPIWTSWDFVGVFPSLPCADKPTWPPFGVYPILGAVAGCVSLAAAAVVLAHRRRLRLVLLAIVAIPLVAATGIVLVRLATAEPADPLSVAVVWSSNSWSNGWLWLPKVAMCLLLPSVIVVLWLALLRAAAVDRVSPASDRPRLRRRDRRVVARASLGLLGVVMLVPLVWAYYILMTPPPIPNDPLPEPNGYDTLLRIGKSLEQVSVPAHDDELPEAQRATPKEFRDFCNRYRAVLDEIHTALDEPYRIPLKYDATDIDLESVQLVRQTARALEAAARVATTDGDEEAASRYDLDTLRLGSASGRGGLVVDWLVGSAVQSIGLYAVHEQCGSMTPPMRRQWIAKLPALEADFESMDTCLAREDIWLNHAYGWQGRLISVVEDRTSDHLLFAQCESRRQALFRLLIVELALANYRDAYGAYPRTLEALVPEPLETLPEDPFSGKPFVYRLTDDGYQLYSVGPNGVDDGRKSLDDDGDDEFFR